MGGTLQFAELLEEGAHRLVPACCKTTGSYHMFEHMVRTHGRSPISSFLLCPRFGDALGMPREAYVDFPRAREWEAAAAAVYRERFTTYAIRPQDILLRLPDRRIYILRQVQEFLADLHAEWEERQTRWTLGARNALEAGNISASFSGGRWKTR